MPSRYFLPMMALQDRPGSMAINSALETLLAPPYRSALFEAAILSDRHLGRYPGDVLEWAPLPSGTRDRIKSSHTQRTGIGQKPSRYYDPIPRKGFSSTEQGIE
jgi:hypothetical protein